MAQIIEEKIIATKSFPMETQSQTSKNHIDQKWTLEEPSCIKTSKESNSISGATIKSNNRSTNSLVERHIGKALTVNSIPE